MSFEEPAELRVFPLELQMAHGTLHQDQVKVSASSHLVGD